MAMCKVYDENITVDILRNGKRMTVPFRELVSGDVVFGSELDGIVVGIDAHSSGDACYTGWLLYDENGVDFYPEDFEAKRIA